MAAVPPMEWRQFEFKIDVEAGTIQTFEVGDCVYNLGSGRGMVVGKNSEYLWVKFDRYSTPTTTTGSTLVKRQVFAYCDRVRYRSGLVNAASAAVEGSIVAVNGDHAWVQWPSGAPITERLKDLEHVSG